MYVYTLHTFVIDEANCERNGNPDCQLQIHNYIGPQPHSFGSVVCPSLHAAIQSICSINTQHSSIQLMLVGMIVLWALSYLRNNAGDLYIYKYNMNGYILNAFGKWQWSEIRLFGCGQILKLVACLVLYRMSFTHTQHGWPWGGFQFRKVGDYHGVCSTWKKKLSIRPLATPFVYHR